MIYNDHSRLDGKHAILAPSNPSWLNYNSDVAEERLRQKVKSLYSQDLGTVLHKYAASRIEYGLKMNNNKSDRNNLLMYLYDNGIPQYVIDLDFIFTNFITYVNDAIGFRMDPEIKLYYSDLCFGTVDAISFRKNQLRIHDLKSGVTPAHMEQLEIYAALFLLEYSVDPFSIFTELRIYQNESVLVHNPSPEDLKDVMNKIIFSADLIEQLQSGE